MPSAPNPPRDKHGLLSAPITPVLRKMTLPMIFGLIAILMFNLVDTFFIAMLGTDALAAISFTFPITFAVNCITMGIGVGLSSLIGQQLGQGNHHAAARLTSHGLLLAVLLVCMASTVGVFTIEPLFRALGASSELVPMIHEYMAIWYVTIPLLVVPMAGNSAIRATGDTKTPAKIMMVAGCLNGLLDPLLIFGLGPFPALGIQGAAIASAISWAGALSCSGIVLIKREKLLSWPERALMLKDWRRILKIGTPAGLTSAMNPLSGAILMVILAAQGNAAVAAYGAAQRIESILLIVIMALASIFTPFMAQNMGAGLYTRAFKALFVALRFSFLFQLFVYILLVPLTWPITYFFTQDVQVQDHLWLYLVIVPASYGLQGVLMILVSALNALQRSTQAMCWNIVRLFGLLLPAAWVASTHWGTEGIFVGIAIANLIAGLGAYLYALRLRREYLSETASL
ncbi:MATE family efflux transporter [Thaumasiovibrio subtropicus]|uniref:MATE family efflux transporter n=1 Tax=Thaumasiovibrio subtropicus TaxID=1891207 RepID=UPI000B34FEA8|nr:MATE family efflux transporter [Thaumasiovibrio subtropicus]